MNRLASCVLGGIIAAFACDAGSPGKPGSETKGAQASAALADFIVSELVGRPTDTSISVKAIAAQAVQAYVEYGPSSGQYPSTTAARSFQDGVVLCQVTGLAPDTQYFYRLRYRYGNSGAYQAGDEHRFVTQRGAGQPFTFAVQSDSHQGFAAFYSDALYGITLDNILQDAPDFLFDLGDTFSTDAATETMQTVRTKYRTQRRMFDLVGHSTPVFLVLGNHENEEGWNLDDFDDVSQSLPVLGANARKRFFLNPVPNDFYTGNADPMPALDGDQLREDYYAFTWGDALFVAIDPFWYTARKPFSGTTGGEKDDEVVGDRWDWTLGEQQYDWLRSTLAGSSARYKFVFAHHLTGGTSDYGRAGAAGAKYCEWGGYDPDGTTYGFDVRRPGWEAPIHDLFVKHGVSVFFHGHDHVFAKEELDGVVYQACPHAANDDYGSGFATNTSDYADADRVNNSGYLRVTVSPREVGVSYVRSFLEGDGDNGSVAYSYTIAGCADCQGEDAGGAGGAGGGSNASAGAGAPTEAGTPGAPDSGGAGGIPGSEPEAGESGTGRAGSPELAGGTEGDPGSESGGETSGTADASGPGDGGSPEPGAGGSPAAAGGGSTAGGKSSSSGGPGAPLTGGGAPPGAGPAEPFVEPAGDPDSSKGGCAYSPRGRLDEGSLAAFGVALVFACVRRRRRFERARV